MNQRKVIGISVAGGIFIVAVAFIAFGPHEPTYEGKPLGVWLADLQNPTRSVQIAAREAITRMGTNALPALIDMMRAEDSRLKRAFMDLAEKQTLVKFRFSRAGTRRQQAAQGFQVLRKLAEPAIPALIDLLGKDQNAADAIRSLRSIGLAAAPPLTERLDSGNGLVRSNSAIALCGFPLAGKTVVPALIKASTHSDPDTRSAALIALGHISRGLLGDERGLIEPALTGAVRDTNSEVRDSAARALDRYHRRNRVLSGGGVSYEVYEPLPP